MTIELQTISFNIRDGVGHLVMAQPPGNQMTLQFFSELGTIVSEIKQIDELSGLVISGAGRHYSSGAALEELLGQIEKERLKNGEFDTSLLSFLQANQDHFRFFEEAPFPVISAIRGACLGSAFELALLSHFRFCGEDAVMGLPETTFGLIPGIGGSGSIQQLAGKAKALELVLCGTTFGADEAFQMGLVDAVLPKKQVVEWARQFVHKIRINYRKEKKTLYLERFRRETIST